MPWSSPRWQVSSGVMTGPTYRGMRTRLTIFWSILIGYQPFLSFQSILNSLIYVNQFDLFQSILILASKLPKNFDRVPAILICFDTRLKSPKIKPGRSDSSSNGTWMNVTKVKALCNQVPLVLFPFETKWNWNWKDWHKTTKGQHS